MIRLWIGRAHGRCWWDRDPRQTLGGSAVTVRKAPASVIELRALRRTVNVTGGAGKGVAGPRVGGRGARRSTIESAPNLTAAASNSQGSARAPPGKAKVIHK